MCKLKHKKRLVYNSHIVIQYRFTKRRKNIFLNKKVPSVSPILKNQCDFDNRAFVSDTVEVIQSAEYTSGKLLHEFNTHNLSL